MTLTIEKGIPYPKDPAVTTNTKYTFVLDMEIGDSVDVSGVTPSPRQFYVGMTIFGGRRGMKFSKRGDRVWRVS